MGSKQHHTKLLDEKTADSISMRVGKVFQPRTPINTRELFAGRWDLLTTVVDSVSQIGLHIIIYGERGVGKTSLANIIRPLLHVFDDEDSKEDNKRLVIKVNAHAEDSFSDIWVRALDEISWYEEKPQFGYTRKSETDLISLRTAFNLGDILSIDDIRRTLHQLENSVFIFDEFDRLDHSIANQFTDLIKTLQDFAEPVTVIIVGVADTVDGLIKNHASIGRAIIQIPIPRMKSNELRDILKKGEENLGIHFNSDAATRIVNMSQGLPHYTHLVGQFSVRKSCMRLSSVINKQDVNLALSEATKQAQQSIITKFSIATHSAHSEALYDSVLLACAISSWTDADDLGFFRAANVVKPLSAILPTRSVGISMFNKHLSEFCDEKRGSVLERTGPQRGYRYRFSDPLLPPFIIMKGYSTKLISDEYITQLTDIET